MYLSTIQVNVLNIKYNSHNRLWLEFVTGRAGVGFHLPGPTLITCRGGYFGRDSRPAPVWGKSPHIPYMAPHFSPLVLTGTSVGIGRAGGMGRKP